MVHVEFTVTRRHLIILTGLLLAILLLVPGASWASHQFSDVPDSDWAHDDISWLADAGVTLGCGDGSTFCPDDPVTRREMAVFMHRLSTGEVVDASTAVNADHVDGLDSTAFSTLGHDHDADYLTKTGKAVDADKVDGFSVESIAPRASGVSYVREHDDPDMLEATVTIDAPARGIVIAHAGGNSYGGTDIVGCTLNLDNSAGWLSNGYVDHAQDSEADCIVSGSIVVAAGLHRVELNIVGDGNHTGNLWAMWIPFDGWGAVPTL